MTTTLWVYDDNANSPVRSARPRWHAGFTLVEILIVVGVIAALAAIIIPVLSSAREKGRQTVCLSNLKQLYGALEMYRMDTGEWATALNLEQYSAGKADLICPDNPRPGEWGYSNWNIWWDNPNPEIRKLLQRKARERGPMYPIIFCIYHIRGWGVVPVLRADGSASKRKVRPNCSIGVLDGDVCSPDL